MSDVFYAGMIPFYLAAPATPYTFLIYKIDTEVGDGGVVPNRGVYTLGDDNMYVVDINSPEGQLVATSAANASLLVGPSSDYYTVLIRAGNVQSPITSVLGTNDSLVQMEAEGWVWGLFADASRNIIGTSFQRYQSLFLLDALDTINPDTDVVLMATIDAFGGTFRVVICDGVTATNWSTLSPVFNPGNFGINTVRLQKAFGFVGLVNPFFTWSQSYNGIAIWHEECVTDADFIRLYNDFASA